MGLAQMAMTRGARLPSRWLGEDVKTTVIVQLIVAVR